MPLLAIDTNVDLDAEDRSAFLAEAGAAIAAALDKPQRVVMVSLKSVALRFAETETPAAFVELRAIGLPEQRTAALSETICGLLQRRLDIPAERVFINFADVPRHLWGWDGRTF